jgi:hypothetical protein
MQQMARNGTLEGEEWLSLGTATASSCDRDHSRVRRCSGCGPA